MCLNLNSKLITSTTYKNSTLLLSPKLCAFAFRIFFLLHCVSINNILFFSVYIKVKSNVHITITVLHESVFVYIFTFASETYVYKRFYIID